MENMKYENLVRIAQCRYEQLSVIADLPRGGGNHMMMMMMKKMKLYHAW